MIWDDVRKAKLAERFVLCTKGDDKKSGDVIEPGQYGDVIIEHCGKGDGYDLVQACAERVRQLQHTPYLIDRGHEFFDRVPGMADAELEAIGAEDLARLQPATGHIIFKNDPDMELVKASQAELGRYQRLVTAQTDSVRRNKSWLIVNTPTTEFRRACGMGVAEFQTFYADVCTYDHERMRAPSKPLIDILNNGNEVHIIGAGTNLKFRLDHNYKFRASLGLGNLPDGESFGVADIESAEGFITYGPSRYRGHAFPWVKLVFEKGVIKDAYTDPVDMEALHEILNTDPGARRIGEFAIGFNPLIHDHTGNQLFDEKIHGSIHFTPGRGGSNVSAIHWDLVKILRLDHGGGHILIDGREIQRDGRFVVPELEALNPEYLLTA